MTGVVQDSGKNAAYSLLSAVNMPGSGIIKRLHNRKISANEKFSD